MGRYAQFSTGASYKKVTPNDFTEAVKQLLAEYGEEVQADIDEVIPKVAKEAQRRLKTAGKPSWKIYNASWAVDAQKKRYGVSCVVHNTKRYQLTHLLEFSHPMPQGGMSTAYPHIAPVNDWVQDEVVRLIEEKLQK